MREDLRNDITEFVLSGVYEEPFEGSEHHLWSNLRELGTELRLDERIAGLLG